MSYELFLREQQLIEASKALLDSDKLRSKVAREEFGKLLKGYEKLFKDTRRLVRISDRNEAELNRIAHALDEKNAMLESLSSKLSKYLSPQVYKSIFSGDRDVSISSERKKLTVFFSDIKDFTATTDDMEPEDLTALLNHYLTEMSAIALNHGGTIDKYIGDAVVIFFGDPETLGVQKDALQCVRMAVAMQRRMRELQREWMGTGIEKPFHMRVGINTGFCTVGNFGSEARMDYTIIGGEVNLAARLEGICEPDGITLSYETYALVSDEISAVEGEPIKVKGIQRDVRPYAVQGIHDQDQSKKILRHETDGVRVLVDLYKLDDAGRAATADQLESIIAQLRAGA
ncbi:MAG: adenylate/guanylate cyclase domain-containing protein [Hyphomicrobiales bacterium]|nr:adenylate/guanylate cyclase domain-containing protein [Hyphomicrobiales bacterium]